MSPGPLTSFEDHERDAPVIDHGLCGQDRARVSLRDVDDANWRAVAVIAPRDDQRDWVAALAAFYLLLGVKEGIWRSLAIYADDLVVGHLMWVLEPDDGSHWIGGVVIAADQQGKGYGTQAMRCIMDRLRCEQNVRSIKLSIRPENRRAAALYTRLGFQPTGAREDDEIVLELRLKAQAET